MKKSLKNSVFLIAVPLVVMVVSLCLGNTESISLKTLCVYVLDALKTTDHVPTQLSESMHTILWQVRLPRIVLTFLVGAALGSAGNTLQALMRNPIVDPFTLGISSGAAFGAALAMVIPFLPVTLSAFIFGVAAVFLTYSISYGNHQSSVVAMVLSGMLVSGIFTAFLTLLQYLSDPYKLQAIVSWTMGSLHTASWDKVQTAILPIVVGCSIMVACRWKLNLLSLGDNEALAVGVNPKFLKLILVFAATLVTASAVSVVGVISLFGLITPHISRMLFGPSNHIGVWANIAIGGTLLLLIDDFSRVVMPFEIPIGVFTMVLGAPIFIYFMRKNTLNWKA